jgi:hypothetical protein
MDGVVMDGVVMDGVDLSGVDLSGVGLLGRWPRWGAGQNGSTRCADRAAPLGPAGRATAVS